MKSLTRFRKNAATARFWQKKRNMAPARIRYKRMETGPSCARR
jgi:hypothetical protein